MSPETYENAVKWRRDMTKIEITGHVLIHTDINLAKKEVDRSYNRGYNPKTYKTYQITRNCNRRVVGKGGSHGNHPDRTCLQDI